MQLDLIFITVFVSGEKVIKYVGVSDKIDGNWNERKPPFLTMYSCAHNKPTFSLIMKQIKCKICDKTFYKVNLCQFKRVKSYLSVKFVTKLFTQEMCISS